MKKTQAAGLILWRGGYLSAAAYAAYLGAKQTLYMAKAFGIVIPRPAEIGMCLVMAGFLLVMASLALENIQDSRAEKGNDE